MTPDSYAKKLARERARYHANLERERARVRAYATAHPEKSRARTLKYLNANRELINERTRQRYKTNTVWREKRKHEANEWNKAHRERATDTVRRHKKLPAPTRPCPKVCEICKRPSKRGQLHLDHCHQTGKFRGWLCRNCNLALGLLADTPLFFRRAASYLETYATLPAACTLE